MLKRLYIQNYALIRNLEILPSPGLNIITGETGSGKSIMIGAVGLLLGNRADTKVLYDPGQKCIIEGTFYIRNYKLEELFALNNLDYSEDSIIRREIAPGGKSRAFVNDTPVTLEVMKLLGSELMEIHSQNDTLKLGSSEFQLYLIDSYAGNGEILKQYSEIYKQYVTALSGYKMLQQEAERIRKDADYNHFLYEELSKAELAAGEQLSLEEESSTLEHAEEIKIKLLECSEILQNRQVSVTESLASVFRNLEQVSSFAPHLKEISERVNSSLLEIKDLSGEVERLADHIEADPGRLSFVNERLNLIYRLQQKHHAGSIEDLLTIRADLEIKVRQNLNLDEQLEQLNKLTQKLLDEVKSTGKELSARRTASFKVFTAELEKMLGELGMPEAKLKIDHETSIPAANGIDEIVLRFSANKGVLPKPFREVASGGEFSRLMFCIKHLIAKSIALPTLVLDEIDTGISGEIALKMGKMMKTMSSHHQVIAISHLPQIAAAGTSHYFVFKDNSDKRSVSRIRELKPEERIIEIAKMIGGDEPTSSAYDSARELLIRNN
jgi:DNA repair protein RecN (Recombination protein N)